MQLSRFVGVDPIEQGPRLRDFQSADVFECLRVREGLAVALFRALIFFDEITTDALVATQYQGEPSARDDAAGMGVETDPGVRIESQVQ